MKDERMKISLVSIEERDFVAIRSNLEQRLPETVDLNLEVKEGGFDNAAEIPPKMLASLMQSIDLSTSDYELLGREHGDLTALTFGELDRIGKLPPMGGGGIGAELVIWFASADPSVQAAAIAAIGVIVREIIRGSFGYANTISVQKGEDKVEVSGLPRKEAEEIVEKFFAEIRKEELL